MWGLVECVAHEQCSDIIWQVLNLVHRQIWGAAYLFGNMLIQNVGDERRCSMMIRAMDLHS